MKKIESTIRLFLESQRLDHGSGDLTIQAYGRDLLQFAATLPAGTSLEEIQSSHLEAFIAELNAKRQKPASIARKISALRQFFKFCCLEKHLTLNPAQELLSPKKGDACQKIYPSQM